MAAVGTWAFSLPAVEKMRVLISKGVNSTDCVEDAMAVGTPLAVARKVMEKSAHSLLVGDGAVAFARDHGFTIEDNENMLSNCTSKAYQEFLEEHRSLPGHDTLGLIALDLQGNITVGVSTSGSPFKYPGRVGDSPLPGCGLYADNQAGAAVATGDGDKIMCFCPTFHIVQLMKQGLSPSSACQSVLQEIYQRVGKDNMFELGLIALNMKAEFGAASTIQFPYTAWCIGQDCASSHTRISSSFFA
nr:PREDICTED: N(4)-(Beta-N-acetylglucosaminyl)-L-asparaginase-like isoform X2 [Latimeria chalumnae]|eukprot:XP_005989591.1 PREDICTED: N(4)-(Beta-N-acetylglucosaminyl)-L-asparaginase-like isoform X2 [Latimeria chalumnae]